jgi:hypothetical protein
MKLASGDNAMPPHVILQHFIAGAHPAETAVLDCEFPRPHADTTTHG